MIFVDTWALRARAFPKQDPWAPLALPVWAAIQRNRTPLLTTWMVIDELVNTVANKAGTGAGPIAYQRLVNLPLLTVEPHNDRLYNAALNLMSRYADHRFNLTDAVSILTMKQRGCGRVFTGDQQFKMFGFEMLPD
jgi:predicted nucleic acid-binding protein